MRFALLIVSIVAIQQVAEAGFLSNIVSYVQSKSGPNTNKDAYDQLNDWLEAQFGNNFHAGANLHKIREQLMLYNRFQRNPNDKQVPGKALDFMIKNKPLVEAMQEFSKLHHWLEGNVCFQSPSGLLELFKKINSQAYKSKQNPLSSRRRIDVIFETVAQKYVRQCLAKFAEDWRQFLAGKPTEFEAIEGNLDIFAVETNDMMCRDYSINYEGYQTPIKSLECEIERLDKLGGFGTSSSDDDRECLKIRRTLELIHRAKSAEERQTESELFKKLMNRSNDWSDDDVQRLSDIIESNLLEPCKILINNQQTQAKLDPIISMTRMKRFKNEDLEDLPSETVTSTFTWARKLAVCKRLVELSNNKELSQAIIDSVLLLPPLVN